MKTTFILKNLVDELVNPLSFMAPIEAHEKLTKWAFGDLKHCISQKCGSGQFRDRVEWNAVIRDVKSGAKSMRHSIEPRKGYKLVIFEETSKQ